MAASQPGPDQPGAPPRAAPAPEEAVDDANNAASETQFIDAEGQVDGPPAGSRRTTARRAGVVQQAEDTPAGAAGDQYGGGGLREVAQPSVSGGRRRVREQAEQLVDGRACRAARPAGPRTRQQPRLPRDIVQHRLPRTVAARPTVGSLAAVVAPRRMSPGRGTRMSSRRSDHVDGRSSRQATGGSDRAGRSAADSASRVSRSSSPSAAAADLSCDVAHRIAAGHRRPSSARRFRAGHRKRSVRSCRRVRRSCTASRSATSPPAPGRTAAGPRRRCWESPDRPGQPPQLAVASPEIMAGSHGPPARRRHSDRRR